MKECLQMTNMENWVNKNSEVETEDKENGAVVLTGAADEQIVENETHRMMLLKL